MSRRTLRSARESIADRPRSPPRFAPTPQSLILDICQSGDLSEAGNLMRNIPPWSREDLVDFGLHTAIENNQLHVVQFFLDQGFKSIGSIARKIATRGCRAIPIFDLLKDYGWHVNMSDGFEDTVLGWVIDDEPLVRWLLDQRANPNFGRPREQKLNTTTPDYESGFALENTSAKSTVEVFNLLVDHGAQLEFSAALHRAVESSITYGDRIAMMEHVLDLGFDVNGMDKSLRGPHGHGSPLASAVHFNRVDKVIFLLQHGADPSLKNWRGISPADQAQRVNNAPILELFREYEQRSER